MDTTLVEKYMPLANKLAHAKKRTLPRHIDIEDLQSAAYMGLVEAASRFNSSKGASFGTYAYIRISGAMSDWLREQGWGKKSERTSATSLNTPLDGSDLSPIDILESRPEYNTEFLEIIQSKLGKQAEQIIAYYFIDEHSMKEVGARFGVSESRISQLISSYKDRIKENWSDFEADLAA